MPGCVLMPPQAFAMVEAASELVARSGFAPYAACAEHDARSTGRRGNGGGGSTPSAAQPAPGIEPQAGDTKNRTALITVSGAF